MGGKNKIPMADLKSCLEELGCENVVTYIQSGNVVLSSTLDAKKLTEEIEACLPEKFELDNSIIKVLVLNESQIRSVVDNRPGGFGDEPEKFHSDVIFLMNIDATEAMKVFSPREGVDKVWPGEGVVYSTRLSAKRTKSRLNKIVGTPAYKSMTIRNWNTTKKLLELIEQD